MKLKLLRRAPGWELRELHAKLTDMVDAIEADDIIGGRTGEDNPKFAKFADKLAELQEVAGDDRQLVSVMESLMVRSFDLGQQSAVSRQTE